MNSIISILKSLIDILIILVDNVTLTSFVIVMGTLIDNVELNDIQEPTYNLDFDGLNYSSEDNSIYDNSGHKLIISSSLQEIFDKFIDQHKIELLSKYLSGVNTTIDHDFENNLHILKEHRLLVGGGKYCPYPGCHYKPHKHHKPHNLEPHIIKYQECPYPGCHYKPKPHKPRPHIIKYQECPYPGCHYKPKPHKPRPRIVDILSFGMVSY